MRVTLTGATGRIGTKLVGELTRRGDEVTVLSRDADRARSRLGDVEAHAWDPLGGPAPAAALAGRDAVVHLAGEDLAQRWNEDVKRRILESRELGTRNLVEGIRAADPRPATLLSASAVGYYGDRGADRLDETAPPGDASPRRVCRGWGRGARAAEELGLRVVRLRTGVVLDAEGGALEKMLPPFRLGIGGPVAGGRQYVPWIHVDDVVGIYERAIDDASWSSPVNATAPEPVTNRELSQALGRALRRPAIAPVPGFAVKMLYGEMATLVIAGQRAVPRRALEWGYEFRHPELDEALRSVLR